MERRTHHNSFSFLLGDGPPLTPILPKCDSADTLNFREDARRRIRSLWHEHVVLEGAPKSAVKGLRETGEALALATTFDEVLEAWQ